MDKKEVKKQNNLLQRRLRATFLVGVMILLVVFLSSFVSSFDLDVWVNDTAIISGLPDIGTYPHSSVFYKDVSWYMISFNNDGAPSGFVWSGTTWLPNSTINNSLPNIAALRPSVFYKDASWYLLGGEGGTGTFLGYVWNGTGWVVNLTINSTFVSIPIGGGKPEVFKIGIDWYTIVGNYNGSYSGYKYDTATNIWVQNSTITVGLQNMSGGWAYPTVFNISNDWYLIRGDDSGLFYGWSLASNRTAWLRNTTINSSLVDMGDFSMPTTYFKDGALHMISGKDDGTFIGFSMGNESTPGSSIATVSLLSPSNATIINSIDENFSVNLSITGTNYSYIWKNNTYYIWFNNNTLFNTTYVSGLTTVQTNFSRNIDAFQLGEYKWNAFACYDNVTFGNCSWATNNLTFTYVPFSNTGESYSASTYETKNETFYLNITTISGASKMGAFLVYNGTFYAATHTCIGNTCQVWRKIDIPLMTTTGATENKSFYWQITIFGTFGTSTSLTTTHNQNVSNLVFSNAGCSPLFNATVNFTIYNETDRNLLTSTFKSKFSYWLGDGTVKDTYNFSGNGVNHYLFCINHNLSYITSSYITVNATNSRIYQFVKEIYTNTLRIQKLFIPDNLYSNIIIEVKNQGLVPQQYISVNISRYYPETDTYEIVEHQTTDEYGQINAKLIQNDVKYKFNFFDSSNVLLKTSDLVTVICRSSICVIPFVIEETSDYLEQYDNLSLFDYSLEFDNATNIITYSWDDQRGESSTHRLEVTRYAFNESTVVCNTTSTTTVSSLTCNVGSTPASYSVQTFRRVNGQTEIRITYLQIIVGDYSSTFGIEGLFWVFILLFTCMAIGVYDPKVGAILYGVGFIFMGIIKIIYMPLPVFFANTILCILFIWAIKT